YEHPDANLDSSQQLAVSPKMVPAIILWTAFKKDIRNGSQRKAAEREALNPPPGWYSPPTRRFLARAAGTICCTLLAGLRNNRSRLPYDAINGHIYMPAVW